MGLGIYLDDEQVGQWSYSGFMEFRKKMANAAGIDIKKMEGYFDFDIAEAIKDGSFRRRLEEEGEKVRWDTINDPIVPLLSHSDCEGEMSPEDCGRVAPRLRELIKDWPLTVTIHPLKEWQKIGYPPVMTLPNHDRVQGDSLADGMEEAAKTGKVLRFC